MRLAPGAADGVQVGVRRIPGALLIVANGFLALVSIAALIGIWITPR